MEIDRELKEVSVGKANNVGHDLPRCRNRRSTLATSTRRRWGAARLPLPTDAAAQVPTGPSSMRNATIGVTRRQDRIDGDVRTCMTFASRDSGDRRYRRIGPARQLDELPPEVLLQRAACARRERRAPPGRRRARCERRSTAYCRFAADACEMPPPLVSVFATLVVDPPKPRKPRKPRKSRKPDRRSRQSWPPPK